MQDEIAEYKIMLKALEHEAKSKLNKATHSDTTNLQWMLLMFRQRISTLSMFCLDVQCLIERRVDVTKLLSQVKFQLVNEIFFPNFALLLLRSI